MPQKKRPRGHFDRQYSIPNHFKHSYSSSCSDLSSSSQSTSLSINNSFFSCFYLLFCRQAVAEADSDPGSPGRREALSVPDGAVEALPGEALLQLEIQRLVWLQVWGQLASIPLSVRKLHHVWLILSEQLHYTIGTVVVFPSSASVFKIVEEIRHEEITFKGSLYVTIEIFTLFCSHKLYILNIYWGFKVKSKTYKYFY